VSLGLEIFLQILISAICTGGLYGLFSSGFTFQMGALQIIDVSYGAWLMVAMYLMYTFKAILHMNFFVAMILIIFIFFFIGYAMRKFLFSRCATNTMVQLISTMAANFIIMNFMEFIFQQTPRSSGMRETYITLGNIPVSVTRLMILVLAIVVLFGFQMFLNKTWVGRGIRAIVQQRDIAQVVGVNADRTLNIAYGMGYMMAALAGCMLAIFIPVTPHTGAYYQTLSFIICIAAGKGYMKAALIIGIFIGVIEAFLQFYAAQFSMPIIFLVCVLALVLRPNGLFNSSTVKKA
jgi:branched-chain amino acid transport system permease protein